MTEREKAEHYLEDRILAKLREIQGEKAASLSGVIASREIMMIAADFAERLLKEYRRQEFEAIQDNAERNFTPQMLVSELMDRLEDDSRLPWAEAIPKEGA